MPKIHAKSDGSGYYIKARYKNKISTYQVTIEGEQLFARENLGDGDTITGAQLQNLISWGYVYTGGSGPGDIEEEYSDLARVTKNAPVSRYRPPSEDEQAEWKAKFRKRKKERNDQSIILAAVIILLVICCCLFMKR